MLFWKNPADKFLWMVCKGLPHILSYVAFSEVEIAAN